jgi:hypothetical protein
MKTEMGFSRVGLPFDGCASTNFDEVQRPRVWPLAILLALLLFLLALAW